MIPKKLEKEDLIEDRVFFKYFYGNCILAYLQNCNYASSTIAATAIKKALIIKPLVISSEYYSIIK